MNRVYDITNLEAMDELLEKSYRKPVLLFKHSSTCPLSAYAFHQLMSFLETHTEHLLCGMVVVQRDREVSNKITSRFKVPHQSPQALLLQNGKVIWHNSHNRITVENFIDAVQRKESEARVDLKVSS